MEPLSVNEPLGPALRGRGSPIWDLPGWHSLKATPLLEPIWEPGKGTALQTLSVRGHSN